MGTGLETTGAQIAGRRLLKICLLCLIFLILRPSSVKTLIPFDLPAQNLSLIAGKSIERELSSGETHSYAFKLSQQEFLRIDFYSPNMDLVVSIASPGGNKMLEWNILKQGTAPIASVFDSQGTYLLEVRSPEKNFHSGFYRMGIKASRPASLQDEKLVAACRHLSNAAQFRRQWTKGLLKSAIDEYETALGFWKDLGDLKQEAITLKNTGDVWEMLTEWETALSCYEKAQEIYGRLDDFPGETAVVNAISTLYINRGEYRKALDIYTPAYMAVEDPWLKAQRLHNYGAASFELGEMQKAAEYLNQALTIREVLQDRPGRADSLLNLGYINYATKNLSDAEKYFQQSLDVAESAGHPRAIASALAALGHLCNDSGERQEALEYYHQSLKIFENIGDIPGQCTALAGMAYMYTGLGEYNKAVDYYLKALALGRRVHDLSAEGSIRALISDPYRQLSDYTNALQNSREAVRIYRSISSTLGESYARARVGKALEALDKLEDADRSYIQALDLSRKAGDRFMEGFLLDAIGHLYYRWGQLQKAQEYYTQALSAQQESNDYVQMPTTLYNLARVERDLGDLDPAMEHAGQSLKITESLRIKVDSPELRGSYLASMQQQYELNIDLLMEKRREIPSGQFGAEALEISEQARARSLLDILAEANTDIREGVDRDLLEEERSLRKQLNATANQMQLPKEKLSKEEGEALAEEIDAIVTKYQEVQARIRSKSPRYAALTQPQPLNLLEIQKSVLDEDTVLLEYHLGEERSYFWAATSTILEGHDLPKRAEIERRVRHVRELMLERQRSVEETGRQYRQRLKDADAEYWKEAAALSRILLGPASDRLESNRLLIVPDGILQYLPFGALPEPRSAGNNAASKPEPLIERHEIVNLPSVSVLGVLRQETRLRPLPPKTVAVLADPVFEADDPRIKVKISTDESETASVPATGIIADLPLQPNNRDIEGGFSRLKETRDEADSIMKLIPGESGLKLLDFKANRTVALGPELGQYRIIHFATHGVLNNEHPELCGLALSRFDEQGHPQEGWFLRLHDIYNMKLPVELVVLSACNTGLGKEVRGEGIVGIVRGFMYAGAKRVIASLWRVKDDATAELMKRFYHHMLIKGETPAAALRKAQLELYEEPRFHAPYYWAAFTLQGEWH